MSRHMLRADDGARTHNTHRPRAVASRTGLPTNEKIPPADTRCDDAMWPCLHTRQARTYNMHRPRTVASRSGPPTNEKIPPAGARCDGLGCLGATTPAPLHSLLFRPSGPQSFAPQSSQLGPAAAWARWSAAQRVSRHCGDAARRKYFSQVVGGLRPVVSAVPWPLSAIICGFTTGMCYCTAN